MDFLNGFGFGYYIVRFESALFVVLQFYDLVEAWFQKIKNKKELKGVLYLIGVP